MRIMLWIVSMSTRSPGSQLSWWSRRRSWTRPERSILLVDTSNDTGAMVSSQLNAGNTGIGAGTLSARAQSVGDERADQPLLHVAGA